MLTRPFLTIAIFVFALTSGAFGTQETRFKSSQCMAELEALAPGHTNRATSEPLTDHALKVVTKLRSLGDLGAIDDSKRTADAFEIDSRTAGSADLQQVAQYLDGLLGQQHAWNQRGENQGTSMAGQVFVKEHAPEYLNKVHERAHLFDSAMVVAPKARIAGGVFAIFSAGIAAGALFAEIPWLWVLSALVGIEAEHLLLRYPNLIELEAHPRKELWDSFFADSSKGDWIVRSTNHQLLPVVFEKFWGDNRIPTGDAVSAFERFTPYVTAQHQSRVDIIRPLDLFLSLKAHYQRKPARTYINLGQILVNLDGDPQLIVFIRSSHKPFQYKNLSPSKAKLGRSWKLIPKLGSSLP